ncbi:MAG TPA: hypothetical protein VMT15_20840 [Bryobacteraceae bacterium]|nr:hypothetical protein [Bryobacteraceae bacterium]
MDHTYIDRNSVAERYLNHSLEPGELREFEEHIVDCQECGDRLLLAEMFHARNGIAPTPDPNLAARVVLYKPRRVLLILLAAALTIPAVYAIYRLLAG